MKIQVIDNFLDDFEDFNDYARQLEYKDIINPFDGVTYPDISVEVPSDIKDDVMYQCEKRIRSALIANTIFMRLSLEGTPCPHQAHNDDAMGQYGFILYMQDGPGGTAFLKHKETHITAKPWTGAEQRAWERDMNTPDAWDVHNMVEMKANRALLYPAKLMHRAEPIGGFGDSVENGRLVLTAFLSRK